VAKIGQHNSHFGNNPNLFMACYLFETIVVVIANHKSVHPFSVNVHILQD
jgi:hypothetical protein